MRAAILLAVAIAGTLLLPHRAPAQAADASPYLDDRSTPESLIRSLYNAVNRQEYARAYTYFDPAPAADFDTYVAGFENTVRVELALGEPSEEGAAGSTFWRLPAAIRSYLTDGSAETFAGCYTLRLAQSQIQSPPFRPIHIIAGELEPVGGGGAPEDAVPDSCPE